MPRCLGESVSRGAEEDDWIAGSNPGMSQMQSYWERGGGEQDFVAMVRDEASGNPPGADWATLGSRTSFAFDLSADDGEPLGRSSGAVQMETPLVSCGLA